MDYMHQILLGIMRGLLKSWFDIKNHKQLWYCGRKKDEVDSRLLNIKPPSYIQRAPRGLATLPHWKASEYRNILLFYLVPCLKRILPDIYLQHASLLATGTYNFCKAEITPEDMETSEECFKTFERLMSVMYSDQHRTLNVHTLIHQADLVRHQGSFHDNSNFDFEDLMGEAKNSVHGAQSLQTQIANNMLLKAYLPSLRSRLSDKGKDLFDKITQKQHITFKQDSPCTSL